MLDTASTVDEAKTHRLRRAVRYTAVALTGLSAVIYFMIGFRVVTVIDDDTTGQTGFGLIAGTVFLIAAAVAMRYDRRWLWVLGAAGLAFIIYTYFNLAPERIPEYATWGILLRVIQVPLMVILGYLAISHPGESEAPQ